MCRFTSEPFSYLTLKISLNIPTLAHSPKIGVCRNPSRCGSRSLLGKCAFAFGREFYLHRNIYWNGTMGRNNACARVFLCRSRRHFSVFGSLVDVSSVAEAGQPTDRGKVNFSTRPRKLGLRDSDCNAISSCNLHE